MGFAHMRKRSNLTQGQVAKELGVDQSAVCLWETGKTHPRVSLLLQVAALYGCSVDDLLSPDDEDDITP